MASSNEGFQAHGASRAGLVRQVIEDCLRRRSSGEHLLDDDVISAHAELLPELEFELRKLRLVERARHRAALDAREPSSSAAATAELESALPEHFEGYEVVREIHHGGQGVVYEAIQKSTRRKVAIKVLHGGPFADARSRARLEREIQILGRIQHPNIVRIYDSGTAAGYPYYVMDYISGQALDAWTAAAPRPVADRLRLFAKICDAINAAHLRGVIHRDLKPSNIRVDADGEPHVLDFGLAKVALDAVTEEERPQLMSMTGQFIGSLPWASPEQAAGEIEKVDLRTDVYALGVVLFQMLTGQFPYEVSGPVGEVLERIRHAAPLRPRAVGWPGRPDRGIDDELETVVLKCLEKERERRYQSAGELARDIRHYLVGEPIEAKRASTLYMLSKSLRRYRAALAVGAAFLVLTGACAVVMAVLYQKAEHEARKAERVADFLDRIFVAVDPETARGRDVTFLRRAVDEAARELTELRDEPEVEARVRNSLGRLYVNLGLYAEAEEHLRRAVELRRQVLGPQAAGTAESLNLLGWALKERGQYDAAQQAYDEALAINTARFGRESLPVAQTLNGLGQLCFARRGFIQARTHLTAALDLNRRRGAPPRELATTLANLGSVERELGELDTAEPLLREALELRRRLLGAEHPETIVSLNKLALLLRAKGRHAEARPLFEEYITLCRQVLGEKHAHVGVALNNLGLTLFDEGRYAEAAEHFRQAVDVYRAARGPAHPQVAGALLNWAGALEKQGEFAAAAARCAEALAILAPDDPRRAQALFLQGQLHVDRDDPAGAVEPLRAAFEINRQALGYGHAGTLRVEGLLAGCLTKIGQFEAAETLLRARQAEFEQTAGADDPRTAAIVDQLIALYEAWGRPDEAARYRTLRPASAETAPVAE